MPSLKALFIREIVRQRAPDFDHRRPTEAVRRDLDAASDGTHAPHGTQKIELKIGDINAQWIIPPDVPENRVILYLHGGAYIAGSIRSHSNMVAYFAHIARTRALLIEYRLAPEHPFPAALDDAVTAYRWLLENNIAPNHIVIMGDSAGGGLTLATLLKLRDDGIPPPAAAVCISPWTDLAGTGASLRTHARKDPWLRAESVVPGAAHYHGAHPPTHPLISPLYADLCGLPPVLIHVGDHEILLDDAQRVAEKIRACAGDVELEVFAGMWHVFHGLTTLLPESRAAIDKIGHFIQRHLR